VYKSIYLLTYLQEVSVYVTGFKPKFGQSKTTQLDVTSYKNRK